MRGALSRSVHGPKLNDGKQARSMVSKRAVNAGAQRRYGIGTAFILPCRGAGFLLTLPDFYDMFALSE